jgi:hypothetical protein
MIYLQLWYVICCIGRSKGSVKIYALNAQFLCYWTVLVLLHYGKLVGLQRKRQWKKPGTSLGEICPIRGFQVTTSLGTWEDTNSISCETSCETQSSPIRPQSASLQKLSSKQSVFKFVSISLAGHGHSYPYSVLQHPRVKTCSICNSTKVL